MWSQSAARIFAGFITAGRLEIRLPGGNSLTIKGKKKGPAATIRLKKRRHLFALACRPDLAAGELYMEGNLTVEKGSLEDFLDLLTLNSHGWMKSPLGRALFFLFSLGGLGGLGAYMRSPNSRLRARRNVKHHYELRDELFNSFLDEQRQYSCAYFRSPTETVASAQTTKIARLLAKLNMKPGVSLLDIGCGWGGLCLSAHRCEPTARVTGITLSESQLAYFKREIAELKAGRRVRGRLLDFRDLKGKFDRIVSVGMMEHVGSQFYPSFFKTIEKSLTAKGVALVHCIGRFSKISPTNRWLDKHIFPGTYAPNLSMVVGVIEKVTDLKILDVEIMRLHYAETLKKWREKFRRSKKQVERLYDEKFFRMWEFYLTACECFFRNGGGMVFQIQLAHKQDAVPVTRTYVGEKEAKYKKILDRVAVRPKAP